MTTANLAKIIGIFIFLTVVNTQEIVDQIIEKIGVTINTISSNSNQTKH
jgi:hypothetical protein